MLYSSFRLAGASEPRVTSLLPIARSRVADAGVDAAEVTRAARDVVAEVEATIMAATRRAAVRVVSCCVLRACASLCSRVAPQ